MWPEWCSKILRWTLIFCCCWCAVRSGTCTEASRLRGTAFIDYEKVVQTHVKKQELYKAKSELAITQKTVEHLDRICSGCVWSDSQTHSGAAASETHASTKSKHLREFRSWQELELKKQVEKLHQLEAKTDVLQAAIATDIESAARASAKARSLVLVLKNVYYSDGMPDLTDACILSLSKQH